MNYQDEIRKYAADVLKNPHFRSTRGHIQHGNMSVYRHCINVAKYSLRIADYLEGLGILVRRKDLVRGALLHDFFLYDWHDPVEEKFRLHGFRHPAIAYRNAKKEFGLTKCEREIIRKHMWPLTVVPPFCKEAWIVTVADKWCSAMETMYLHKENRKIR